jgi:predicted Zn-dependent protease
MSRRRFLAGGAALTLAAGCDRAPALVSDETVEAMGLEAWTEMSTQMQRTADTHLQGVLDAVAERMIRAAGERPGDWEVVVFARPDINAFALPGRKIGVFEGMFSVTESPDQLAAIVGHEIGHLQAEHAQERMSAQVAQGWFMRIVSLLLNIGEVEYAAEIAAALGLGMQYGVLMPYSRRQELEADRLGLVSMAKAGYAPGEAVVLWQRMEAAMSGRPPEFLATHPAPASRIREIEAYLPEIDAG